MTSESSAGGGASGASYTRIAFVMSVHEGMEAEYEARHTPIWPELAATLREHGARNYSIFLLPATRQLFAVAEVASLERWQAIARTDVCRRWWAHMAPLMPCNADGSPVAQPARQVFHHD